MAHLPERLLEGYRSFMTNRYDSERHHYRALAREGQAPEILMIACCDSRSAPEVIFNAAPGELFAPEDRASACRAARHGLGGPRAAEGRQADAFIHRVAPAPVSPGLRMPSRRRAGLSLFEFSEPNLPYGCRGHAARLRATCFGDNPQSRRPACAAGDTVATPAGYVMNGR